MIWSAPRRSDTTTTILPDQMALMSQKLDGIETSKTTLLTQIGASALQITPKLGAVDESL